MGNRKYFFLFLLLLSGNFSCKKVFFQPEPENDPEALFEALWTDFHHHYGPTLDRNINWDSLYAVHRPRVDAASSSEELYQVLCDMLLVPDDGHVNLMRPDETMFRSNHYFRTLDGDSLFNLDIIRENYLHGNFETDEYDGFVYGQLDSNLAYIHLPYVGDNFPALQKVVDDFPGCRGLIIDLRHNQGGDFTYCFSEMGRFTSEERFVFSSTTKNGPGENDWTPWYDWYIHPGENVFDKPIVVLTDRFTISAGERTVMAFMSLPNVTVIGDTTNGAHSTMIGRELANGWTYTLPTQRVFLPDGNSWEGIGLPPDIYFVNQQAEVNAGMDKTLERAMAEF